MTGKTYAQALEETQALSRRKTELESQLEAGARTLEEQGTNMTNSLVDLQGFPRADLDIYLVRQTRADIIRLQNDYRDLLKTLAKALEELHALAVNDPQAVANASAAANAVPGNSNETPDNKEEFPMAIVDGIHPESPAAAAGLQRGDAILSVGSALSASQDSENPLAKISTLVQGHVDVMFNSIPIAFRSTHKSVNRCHWRSEWRVERTSWT